MSKNIKSVNFLPISFNFFFGLKYFQNQKIGPQLAFINNPISGALILAVLLATNWKVAIGTILGGSVATFAEMVMIT
jgi:hypothetical protein